LVELWDLKARRQRASWQAGSNEICVVTLSPDGDHVAAGNVNGEVQLWSTIQSKEVAIFRPTAFRVTALAFSPDGRTLASASAAWLPDPRRVFLWSVDPFRAIRELDADDVVTWIAFAPDGLGLAACTLNSDEVRLWDLQSLRPPLVLRGHVSGVMRVAFAPDGKSLATGAFDGRVKLWSLAAQQEVLTLPIPIGALFRSLCFSPDGRALAVGYLHAVGLRDPPSQGMTVFRAPSIEDIAAAERDRNRAVRP
jgi:WD40 repeat protein